ncbi:MAG: hypothetical protein EB084_11285 [Proteobacteria bacterium]|nr:hypothetical protein [Pseudomonadota bacterium]
MMLHETPRATPPRRRAGREAIVGLLVLFSFLVALFHAHDLPRGPEDGVTRVSATVHVAGDGAVCPTCTLIGGAVMAGCLALTGCALHVARVHDVCCLPVRWLARAWSRARAPPFAVAA